MSFLPKSGLMGLAGGLIDGKSGAFSSAGKTLAGPLLGGEAQNLIDKTGVNGGASRDAARGDVGNNGGAGMTPLSGRPRLGRGSTSLSV